MTQWKWIHSLSLIHIYKSKTQINDEKKKKREAERAAKAKAAEIKSIETTISKGEEKLEELQQQLCLEEVYSNPTKSQEVNKEIASLQNEIEDLYMKWEELSE